MKGDVSLLKHVFNINFNIFKNNFLFIFRYTTYIECRSWNWHCDRCRIRIVNFIVSEKVV